MATWGEVQEHLRGGYEVTSDEDESLAIVVAWEGEERTQSLSVSHYDDGTSDWVGLASCVCAEDRLDAREALGRNAQLSIGALSLVDGDYMLTYGLPLPLVADLGLLDTLVSTFAAQADALEGELGGGDEH